MKESITEARAEEAARRYKLAVHDCLRVELPRLTRRLEGLARDAQTCDQPLTALALRSAVVLVEKADILLVDPPNLPEGA